MPSSSNFPGRTLLGPDSAAATGGRGGGGFGGRGDREAEITYEDDVFVGYRHYATKGVKTAYPFGFGLSYTTFAYSGLKLSGTEFGKGLTATVTIRNAGKVAGREVVQLYLSAPGKTMPKPAIELKGFAKTKTLAPGESQTLTFQVTPLDLTYPLRPVVPLRRRRLLTNTWNISIIPGWTLSRSSTSAVFPTFPKSSGPRTGRTCRCIS